MRRGLAEARDAMSRRDATLRASAGRATCRSFLHLADIFSETPSATRGCRDAATVKKSESFRGGKQRDASLTSMAQGEARCLLCETPLGARGTFTAGCCGGRFHEKCVVHHCGQQGARAPGEVRIAPCRDIHRHVSESHAVWLPHTHRSSLTHAISRPSQPQEPCPSCGEQLRKLVSEDPARPSTSSPRRIRYGRQEYHLFVSDHPPAPLATRTLCARLFDIDPARVKLLAKGRALVDESAVADASASGAPILLVGTRRDRLVHTEPAPRRALRRAKRPLEAAWRVTVEPLIESLIQPLIARLPLAPIARAVAPVASHALWCGETFVRSLDPAWKNPYEPAFLERVARRRGGRASGGDARGTVRPPPRPADPGRGPHQFR